MTINALASELVMDRTTLGRNILPLDRDGLITIVKGGTDRRRKELRLTPAGVERMRAARARWAAAQARFEAVFGDRRAADLRDLLGAVVASDLGRRRRTESAAPMTEHDRQMPACALAAQFGRGKPRRAGTPTPAGGGGRGGRGERRRGAASCTTRGS